MLVFVITNTYVSYLDFIKSYQVNKKDFIWLDSPNKIMGCRKALCVKWGILPREYKLLLERYLIPYECILITMDKFKQESQ